MRIAIALVLVVAACKSKSSAPDNKSLDGTGPPSQQPVTGEPKGSERPGQETRIKDTAFAVQATIVFADGGAPASDLPPSLDEGSAKGPSGAITIASKTSFDHTDLSADAVAEKITHEYLAALGNCYRATLARDAKIAGTASLALTVKIDGAVGNATVDAPDATLQSCFSQAMQTWTFPAPKTKDKKAAQASFQVALTLAPQ